MKLVTILLGVTFCSGLVFGQFELTVNDFQSRCAKIDTKIVSLQKQKYVDKEEYDQVGKDFLALIQEMIRFHFAARGYHPEEMKPLQDKMEDVTRHFLKLRSKVKKLHKS